MISDINAETVGSRWMKKVTPVAATPYYPSDGKGGVSTTNTDSELLDADGNLPKTIVIDKIVIFDQHTTNEAIVAIRNHADDAELYAVTVSKKALGLTVVPKVIPVGIEIDSAGFSAESSTVDCDFAIHYRILARAAG